MGLSESMEMRGMVSSDAGMLSVSVVYLATLSAFDAFNVLNAAQNYVCRILAGCKLQ